MIPFTENFRKCKLIYRDRMGALGVGRVQRGRRVGLHRGTRILSGRTDTFTIWMVVMVSHVCMCQNVSNSILYKCVVSYLLITPLESCFKTMTLQISSCLVFILYKYFLSCSTFQYSYILGVYLVSSLKLDFTAYNMHLINTFWLFSKWIQAGTLNLWFSLENLAHVHSLWRL